MSWNHAEKCFTELSNVQRTMSNLLDGSREKEMFCSYRAIAKMKCKRDEEDSVQQF